MRDEPDPGVISALLAYVGDNTGDSYRFNLTPKHEIDDALEEDTRLELLYLRDRNLLNVESTEHEIFVTPLEESMPELRRFARIAEDEYFGDFEEMSRAYEPGFVDYRSEADWPDEPEEPLIEYEKIAGKYGI